jgi:hypothetical protein
MIVHAASREQAGTGDGSSRPAKAFVASTAIVSKEVYSEPVFLLADFMPPRRSRWSGTRRMPWAADPALSAPDTE